MKLPLLATRGVITFPKHTSFLEVGRRASLNAIDLSMLQHGSKIILVSQKDVLKEETNSKDDFFTFGTLATILVKRVHPNGAKSIQATGLNRVKIKNVFFTNNQLIEAEIEVVEDILSADESKERAYVKSISTKIDSIVQSMINLPKDVLTSLSSGISAGELADIVAHYIPLTLDKKEQILETIHVDKRLELINEFIIQESKINKIEKDIDLNVRKTLDTQQKEFLLREKMKAIKEELGDVSSKENEVEKWREELKDKKFPKHVKEIALEEIQKYEAQPPISAEANVIRGYIEWILKLPWQTFSIDSSSIEDAKKILDKHHFGLKKVKERIIEHLAVKMHAKDSIAPIITLVGPPGVGKTSLAKSIAEAVGRQFVKVSLGGVKDESEIRGHRRTYVGAMPGKIIQSFKKAGTSNPVILLDEIDKMSSDYKGDPTSAMLEVLDPEQNVSFQDHYLELEYDLSQVLFLATANYYEQIPTPLLDRVELIFLEQYTSEEKLEIAKNYIIPKVIKDNQLSKSQFKISSQVIEYIIDKYTQEAGVRGLQRIIQKLARKIVVKILTKEITKEFTITKEKLNDLLGKEQVFKETLKGKAEVGLVNGMYYSSVGGGILPIEVTTYDSKDGKTVLTGSIKDVMKESLNIAVAYVRANAKKFNIDFNFEQKTIQVHVPAGATPKDGPSAGIAFTTAIISALTQKPIPKDIALTGEITLRGKVLPIGGLKEKSLGAVEAGVKRIYIPKDNERDLDDLAQKVKDVAKIIPVEDYSEVFKNVFK